jgi:hypothetical protein
MTQLSDSTRVELHPLHVSDDHDEHVVGRADTGTFVSLPPEGLTIIRWLQAGLPVAQVRQGFVERYGEQPDLDDLIDNLRALGFVKSIDGEPVPETPGEVGPRGWQLFGKLPARRVAWLLSRPAALVYLGIWVAVPSLFVLRPEFVPGPTDAIVTDGPMVNVIILASLAWALVFLHEAAHMIATRALDCQSFLSVGHRLHFLVGQTDMTALRTKPRARRYGPYLAGMTWDLTLILACSALAMAGVNSAIVHAMSFLAMIGIIFQFAVFMRTDMYFVLGNWLRLDNLIPDTRMWTRNKLHRLLGRPQPYDLSAVPVRQREILPWYAAFCAVGVLVAVGDFIFFGLPVISTLTGAALTRLTESPLHVAFWEGFAFIMTVAIQFGLLAGVSLRDWKVRRAAATA